MYKYIFSFIFVPLLCLALAMPAQASHGNGNGNHNNNGKAHFNQLNPYHQSNLVYQYNTSSVELTRLYALIAQLQAQLAALQGYNPIYPPYNGGNQSSNEISRVVTGSVSGDGDDSVEFDGSVTFRRDSEARVWFEYGTTNKLSYSTESIEIDGDAGDTEDFEISATDLDDNKVYYYRAVAEDDDGRYIEGVVKSFRFDGRNDDDDDDDDNDNDWSLDVDDDSYETGEYEVGDEDNDNYIALFEAGDDDDDYISRIFVDDEDGYVTFRIYNEGEYEFRLFDEDEDVQAESDEIEVED